MFTQSRIARILWKWVAPIVGVAAIALAVYFYFHSPRPKTYVLRATAGNEVGTRHKLGIRLRDEVADRRVVLNLEPCAGSEEALDWVDRRKVDVALVQGALSPDGRANVRQVATLHVEPLHLLVKKEMLKGASESLSALRGKTVELGEVGSGTHSLAVAILEFVGLHPRDRDPLGGYVPISKSRQELLAEQDVNRLPDAIFLTSSLPSSTTHQLVHRHGYRLVPLRFAEAFALASLTQDAGAQHSEATHEGIIKGRIQAAMIPAFTYGVEPAVPDEPLPTLGTRLLLVAHKDVPARAAYQLVEGTYAAEFGRIVRPPLDTRLLDLPPELPWHEGSVLYQERNAPLMSGQAMDSAHKGFAIFAAVASGLFVLWQWAKLYGIGARTKGFNQYIARVAQIEEQVIEAERAPSISAAKVRGLRDELCRLKTQALDEFARDELAGNELLAGFIIQVNDVRDSLTRLIDQEPVGTTRLFK